MENEKVCKECGATNPAIRMTCQVCHKKLGKATVKAEAKSSTKNPFKDEPTTKAAVEPKKDPGRSEAAKKAWETKKKAAKSRKKSAAVHKLTMNAFKGTLVECSCGAYMKVHPETTAGEMAAWYHRHV